MISIYLRNPRITKESWKPFQVCFCNMLFRLVSPTMPPSSAVQPAVPSNTHHGFVRKEARFGNVLFLARLFIRRSASHLPHFPGRGKIAPTPAPCSKTWNELTQKKVRPTVPAEETCFLACLFALQAATWIPLHHPSSPDGEAPDRFVG